MARQTPCFHGSIHSWFAIAILSRSHDWKRQERFLQLGNTRVLVCFANFGIPYWRWSVCQWRSQVISEHFKIGNGASLKLVCFGWSPPWDFKAYILTYILTFYLTFYLTSILTFCLTSILTFYLPFFLAFYLASILTFYLTPILTFYLPIFLAFCLASILAFYLTSILTFYLASILAFYLASILAIYLTSILAFYLTSILDIYSGILSGIYSDILSDISFWHSICHSFWHCIWHLFWHSLLAFSMFGARRSPQRPEFAQAQAQCPELRHIHFQLPCERPRAFTKLQPACAITCETMQLSISRLSTYRSIYLSSLVWSNLIYSDLI